MTARTVPLEALWRFHSAQISSKWEELVQQVHARGAVAITAGISAELVALSPDAYQALIAVLNASREEGKADEPPE